MDLYTISLRFDDGGHDGAYLTRAIENLPGDVEIIAGRNKDVVTAQLGETAIEAARKLGYVEVEPYAVMDLLG